MYYIAEHNYHTNPVESTIVRYFDTYAGCKYYLESEGWIKFEEDYHGWISPKDRMIWRWICEEKYIDEKIRKYLEKMNQDIQGYHVFVIMEDYIEKAVIGSDWRDWNVASKVRGVFHSREAAKNWLLKRGYIERYDDGWDYCSDDIDSTCWIFEEVIQ